ncbi:hypothetical protein V9T40_000277 [Parthenolecanium corni]|uniref:Uncharacterized protein n=1 Tax=Parthenolecanium corni TaxID=536013 RepID=A0AAN9TD05_9HEMI
MTVNDSTVDSTRQHRGKAQPQTRHVHSIGILAVNMNSAISTVSPSVPTISVTPHSPGGIGISSFNKQYAVLEDNLKQLHDIVEAVQHMKDANISALSVSSQMLKIGEQCIRLSCSCPSLHELNSESEIIGNSITSSPSHADLSASISTPYISLSSFSVYSKQRDSGDWKINGSRISSLNGGEILRRRSWAALEDLSTQGELDQKIGKQRSVSLSSLESDVDDSCLESDSCRVTGSNLPKSSRVGGDSIRSNRRSDCTSIGIPSNISTHSLNEADLVNDFNKIRLKREEELRLLQARLPLQKSISTPSILAIATRDSTSTYLANDRVAAVINTAINNCANFGLSSKSSAEALSSSAYVYDDRSEKRRKRGSSLFFRKKKEKNKKNCGTHSWGSLIHNTSNIVVCDWCQKPIEAKNAKQCAGCIAVAHPGLCVQHLSATDCHQKLKLGNKLSSKSLSQQQQQQNQSSKIANKKNMNINSMVSSTQGSRKSFASTTLCYSPWRRVASKLGVNPIINEEKEDSYFLKNHQHAEDHLISCSEEIPLVTQEFLNEEQVVASDLDTDPFLGLQDDEPETWTPTVKKEVLKKLKDKEIKRQEHMYEFVATEKHHCRVLILMQKIFVDGLKKHFQLGADLQRMFPRLSELTEIHLKFLYNLRKKQKESSVIDSISDVLLEQFSGISALQLQGAYGEFCAAQKDAVNIYKSYMQSSSRFSAFVNYCQNNPLLKKKGIPECILTVTQRITKYPLLIEAIIKTSENKTEVEKLRKATELVKNILVEVNSRVADKEREDRKLEIYNKIDAKSHTTYRNNKFKKSDILLNNRKLRFEGLAHLVQNRPKPQAVNVIVLSDVLFFLIENNNKFSFFTPDGKPGVTSLQKLLVRDLASDPNVIYLILPNPDPEMYVLKIDTPKEKQTWMKSIREAIKKSLEDDQLFDEPSNSCTDEEKLKRAYISQKYMNQIVGILRQKDVEQSLIYEEKITLLLRLLAAAGVDVGVDPPSYCHLVSEYLDNDAIRKEVFSTIQKVNNLTSSLYAFGTNLSRSASSVGERQSNAYVSPILPKRAETFGGFDNAASCKGFVAGFGRKLSQQFQKKSSSDLQDNKSHSPSLPSSPVGTPELGSRKSENLKNISPPTVNVTSVSSSSLLSSSQQLELPMLLQMESEQQSITVQLVSYVYLLSSIIAQQMTSIDSLEAQLAYCRHELNQSSGEKDRNPIYKHNQRLEELRNLQDRLTQEREQWQREKENQQKELDEREKQLLKLQEQHRHDQEDVNQQREQLYRYLEVLSSQGLLNDSTLPLASPQPPSGPSPSLPTSPSSLLMDMTSSSPSPSPTTSSSSSVPNPSSPSDAWRRRTDSVRWKQTPSTSATPLPLNLMSTTNQQKVASSNLSIKQKLPLKLATKLNSSSSSNGGGCSSLSTTPTSSAGTTVSATSPLSAVKMQQQILPWKLREPNPSSTNVVAAGTAELRRTIGGANSSTSGYERLVSAESTVAPTATMTPPSHSRTGSSPAMMQNIRVSSPSSGTDDTESNGGKTNTYPKHRQSPSSTAPKSSTKNVSEEEKVLYYI